MLVIEAGQDQEGCARRGRGEREQRVGVVHVCERGGEGAQVVLEAIGSSGHGTTTHVHQSLIIFVCDEIYDQHAP